jgi:antitoxin VapB
MYIPNVDAKEPVVAKSTVFTSNRSQAVRLPKAVAFPEGVHQVEIIKLGHSRLITPVGRRWDDFFLDGPHVSDDFMSERDQGVAEEREPF